jgi:uncharacterized phage protein (TIGR01671 family)
MRQIKFRAWNKKWERMVDNVLVNSDVVLWTCNLDICHPDWDYLDEDIKVMQFTGLLDKNGKEIYEDDVVIAWSEGCKHIGQIKWRLEGQPAIIIYPAYFNGVFWCLHGASIGEEQYYDEGIEIIGNIYQNPELLEINRD